VDNLRAYRASAELFTMRGRAELIRCPTLITQAENGMLGAKAAPSSMRGVVARAYATKESIIQPKIAGYRPVIRLC